MKSPQDMRIIQIDITNACIHRCSNCTRFCGHHKKPFFMDWDTFKKAVESMRGYKGTVGIMGGEPTLHPQFQRFVEYIKEHENFPKTENWLVKPTRNFMDVVGKMEQRDTYVSYEHGIKRNVVDGWGLWSALSGKYKEYYELIQDTFNMQALNDHKNIMYHSPIMITRREMGIPDEEWHHIRDNCWAQDAWSATITPKGAFFCEIAGALDILFDGPGGWPIEQGWWKRTPKEFGDQLQWCEICGICIDTFTRDANDETDDMSPWYYEQLNRMESPKVKKEGMANVLKITDGKIEEESRTNAKQVRHYEYSESWFTRFSKGNDWLNPTGFTAVGYIRTMQEAQALETNMAGDVDEWVFVTASKDVEQYLLCKFKDNQRVDIVLAQYDRWGVMLNRALSVCRPDQFVIVVDEKTRLTESCCGFLKQYVLNPGTILLTDDSFDMEQELGSGLRAVFSPKAYALVRAGYPAAAAIESFEEFIELWDENKRLPLSFDTFTDYGYEIEKDKKYVIYGAGPTACHLYEQFTAENIIGVVDSDCNKWGMDFYGHTITDPLKLHQWDGEYDKIFVASRSFFEIKTYLLEKGFDSDKIVTSLVVL